MTQASDQINNKALNENGTMINQCLLSKEQNLQLLEQVINLMGSNVKICDIQQSTWDRILSKETIIDPNINLELLSKFSAELFDNEQKAEVDSSETKNSSETSSNLTNLPIYSKWFKFEDIHIIERQELPEFFEEKPSKTSDIYI